jgi:hypothetical protein
VLLFPGSIAVGLIAIRKVGFAEVSQTVPSLCLQSAVKSLDMIPRAFQILLVFVGW